MKEYLMNHGESTVIETVNAAKPNFKKEKLLNAMKYRYATKKIQRKKLFRRKTLKCILETAQSGSDFFRTGNVENTCYSGQNAS